MIHPLTAVTFAAFFGAGFYVFQTKEEVAKLDRELRDIRRQTEAEMSRTQILGAEWARLNDQERLRSLAATHLRHMQPMEPAQFQRLEDAQRRMPVAAAFTPQGTGFGPRTDIATAPGEALVVTIADLRPVSPPVQLARAPEAPPAPAAPVVAAPAPAPAPAPAAPAAAAPMASPSPVAPAVTLAAARPAPMMAAARPNPPERAAPRRTDLAALPPVTTPAQQPRPPQPPISNLPASPNSAIPQPAIRTAMATAPAPMGGSLLGGASLPPPVPFR